VPDTFIIIVIAVILLAAMAAMTRRWREPALRPRWAGRASARVEAMKAAAAADVAAVLADAGQLSPEAPGDLEDDL
jgi:hypothetical protein